MIAVIKVVLVPMSQTMYSITVSNPENELTHVTELTGTLVKLTVVPLAAVPNPLAPVTYVYGPAPGQPVG